ncbi:hypothetical protein V8F20_009851 [Naviculisporaceae sp. PSN 640]
MTQTHRTAPTPFHAGLRGTIWEIFQHVSASGPEHNAVEYELSDTWTYAQLHDAASRLAQQLENHLLMAFGQHVPVMLPRSPAQLVAILALAKIGAVYVPLDPDLPRARIESILASLPSPIVLCLDHQANGIPSHVSTVVVSTAPGSKLLETDFSLLKSEKRPSVIPRKTAQFPVCEDDIASVLFTSGSTGQAKGVKLTHRNLILPARLLAEKENIGPKSRIFQFARSSFDVHLIDILCAFLHGGQLLQVSQENLMTDVSGWMHRLRADTVHLTPSTISMMEPAQIPSLGYMVTCGEPVTPEIINRWGPKVLLTNLYGPCEASSVVSKALQPGDDPSCIGTPSPYASIVVASPTGELCSPGTTGEILVKGGSVCKGYLNADSSKSRFLDFVDDEGFQIPGPWYLTGDHGYFGPSGELHLIGREDDQVKINGQRIELGDIEAVVKKYAPRVAVLAQSIADQQQKRLFAIVSPTAQLALPDENITLDTSNASAALTKTIFAACKSQLPSYMVPRILVAKSIPQSPSGKIDVAKIRSFITSYHQQTQTECTSTLAQGSSLVQRIQNVVHSRLQQQVPCEDNLFEWGFTSLDAIFLIGAIFEITGRRVQFRDLMQNPTIVGVSQLVNACPVTGESSVSSLQNGSTYTPTVHQQSLYHASKLFGHGTYVCPFAFEISSSHFDVERFLAAVEDVYDHHDAFNTAFEEDAFGAADAFIKARIQGKDSWNIGRTSFVSFENTSRLLSDGIPASLDGVVAALLASERRHFESMDLQTHPPAWMTLYQLDAQGERWLPVFKFHHLVIDRPSFHRFWSDVLDAYGRSPIMPKKVTHREFAHLHRHELLSRQDADLKWWTDRAQGFVPQTLFTGENQDPESSQIGPQFCESSMFWHQLPAEDTNQFLHQWKPATGTAFGAWLGLTQLFLHRLTGANQFLLGVPTSLRGSHPLFADVVGYGLTVAVLPVSISATEEVEVAAFFKTAVDTYWDCVEHDQAVGDVLKCFRSQGQIELPKMSVQFAYQDRHDDTSTTAPFAWKTLDVPSRGSHYALVVHLDESTTPPRVGFEYRTKAFTESAVRNMAVVFEDTIQKVLGTGKQASIRSFAPAKPPHPCPRLIIPRSEASSPSSTRAETEQSTNSSTSLTGILSQCWIDILCPGTRPEDLDLNRSFFKSGGDSISVIRFCAKAKSKGVMGCTIGVVYSNPTLSALTQVVRLKEGSTKAVDPSRSVDSLPKQQDRSSAPQGKESTKEHDQQKQFPSPISEPPACNNDQTGKDLDSNQTFASQFGLVLHAKSVSDLILTHHINLNDVENVYPATPMQAAMVNRSSTNSGAYVSQIILHLEGPIDTHRLEKAWKNVVAAHPSLRTSFLRTDTAELDVSDADAPPYLAIEFASTAIGGNDLFHVLENPIMSPAEFEAYLNQDRQAGFPFVPAGRTSCRLALLANYPRVDKHRIIFTCNHATVDGWSIGQLMADLKSAYAGETLKSGQSFSIFIADRLKKDERPAINFWQPLLKDALAPDLESGYCVPPETGSVTNLLAVIHKTPIQAITESQLRQAASQFQVTPFTILQVALSIALHPLQRPTNNTSKVLFWVITSGRGKVDGDTEAVGNFLNTIPCVVQQPDNVNTTKVFEWLHRQQSNFQRALEFDQLPVSEIMRLMDDSQQTGKINTLLVFENHSGAEGTELTANTQVVGVEGREFSDLPFTVVVQPGEENMHFTVKFDTSKVPAGTAHRVLDSFTGVVESMVHQVLSEPHSASNYRVMDFVGGATNLNYTEMIHARDQVSRVAKQLEQPCNDTLVSLVRAAARRFKSCTALASKSLTLSFEELDTMSDRVASYLLSHTDNRTGIVPILLDKSVLMIVAMLGVLKAGRAYCPLEWDAPAARLDRLIRQLGASTVLSHGRGFSKLGNSLNGNSLQVVDFDKILYSLPAAADVDHNDDLPKVTPNQPCYLMFTSGSTGQPKAAVLTHGAVASSVKYASRAYNIEPSSRILLFANYVFDASVTDIYGSLISGATLVLPSDEDELKTDLELTINAHRINWLHVTPTVLKLVEPEAVPGLKTVVIGGEQIPIELARAWREHVPMVVGAYGPTEAAVQVLVSKGMDDGTIAYETLPGNIVLVANQDGQVCRVNEPGEILIAGAQLFGGYNGTSSPECFTHIEGMDPAVKFYRTGDVGRYTSNMRIHILGRAHDSQIKVSGMRISPAEIEYALDRSQPEVLRSGVAVVGGRLHAAVQVRDEGKQLDVASLIASCRSMLPERLVPSVITKVAEIPLLKSLKVDRRTLATILATQQARPTLSDAANEQRRLSPAETTVSGLISDITGNAVAEVDMPLKLQGLDSLGFMRLRGLLAQNHGVETSYGELRKMATLRSIARLIPVRIAQDNHEEPRLPKSQTDVVDRKPNKLGIFPALPSQVTMWVAQQRLRDSRYNVQRVAEYKHVPGHEALRALLEVTSAMSIFYTTFRYQRDSRQVVQVLGAEPRFTLDFLGTLSNPLDPVNELRTMVKNDRQTTFDLENGPLARFKVFAHRSSSYVYSNIHHIMLDAYTSGKFVESIARAIARKPLDLPAVDTADLSYQLTLAPSQDSKQRALDSWREKMQGARCFKYLHLNDGSLSTECLSINKSLTVQSGNRLPAFDTMLSLFFILMHQYTESEDVTVTIPVSARGVVAPEFNGVLGNLTNTVFIRSRLERNDTLDSFMRRVRDFVDFAVETNQPIDVVSSACGLDIQDFSVQFVIHDSQARECNPDIVDLTIEALLDNGSGTCRPKFDLMWHVFLGADSGVQIYVEFNAARHSVKWLGAAVDCYKDLLAHNLALYNDRHPLALLEGTPLVAVSQSFIVPSDGSSWTPESTNTSTPYISDSESGLSTASSVIDDDETKDVCKTKSKHLPDSSSATNRHKSPTEAMESLLIDALRQSLDFDGNVAVDQPLRELGLDSFASMSLISNMYAMAPEIEMSIYDIMEYSTVGALARHLLETHPDFALATSTLATSKVSVETADATSVKQADVILAPTTYIQRQFFLLQEQLGDTTYSLPFLYKVAAHVSIHDVVNAVKAIADEHDVFRTTFQLEGDDIVQALHPRTCHRFGVYDLTNWEPKSGKEKMQQLCMDDCAAVFDLTTGPLIRCFGIVDTVGTQYLFLNFHHIIADKQSVSTLVSHVESISVGRKSVEEIVPKTSGLEVSQRQIEALLPSRTAAAETFWRGVLQTDTDHFGWGISLDEDPSLMFEAAESLRHTVSLDSDSAGWAYSYGATSFCAHLFAFQLLLALRSGTSANSVLIPATCRNPKYGEQEMYGSFINTLPVPLQLDMSGDIKTNLLSFNSRLGRVLSYSHIPFQMIMDMTGCKMGDFDIMFVYHEVTSGTHASSKSTPILEPAMELLPSLPGITAKFPVTFSMTKIKDIASGAYTLKMYVEYNPSLVTEKDAELVCRQFERLLRAINDASGEVDDINGLKTVLDDLEDGPVPRHFHGFSDASITEHDFTDVQILKQARTTPSSTAVVFEDSASASYQQLEDIVRSICSVIQSSLSLTQGGLLNAKVCIVGDVSIERLAALISIMHLGGAYIPIDLKNPLDWNAKIIGDCEPACMVFMPEEPGSVREKAAKDLMQHFSSSIPCIKIPTQLPTVASTTFDTAMKRILPKRRDSDLAYILYTSGSTGVPKGVAIPHSALKNSLHEHRRVYLLSPECKLLGLAPWTFDVSVMDMFGPLSVGATLVIGRHDYLFSDLSEVVSTHSISHISTTPTVASLMHPDDVPTIEMLALGGEPMTQMVRDTWADRIALMNVYGPTEATVDVIWRRLKPDTPVANIGRPFTNVFVYILDDSPEMKQVAVGETGQLALGGVQLARGYIRDPPGKPCPFIEHAVYGRLYLTGDLAKLDVDGTVQCLGRMDTMVNIRGLRVELGAIEEVADVVLVKREGKCVVLKAVRPNGQETLVAVFNVDGDDGKASAETITPLSSPVAHADLVNEMKAAVLGKLPNYFLPSFWIPVEEFPRNKNQKLDRKSVQAFVDGLDEACLAGYHLDNFSGVVVPDKTSQNRTNEKEEANEAPIESHDQSFSPSEMLVVAAFKKILGPDKAISQQSNFFTIGGDSISAIRVCTAIRAAAGKKANVRVRDLYVSPTVEAIAKFIDAQGLGGNTTGNKTPSLCRARAEITRKHQSIPNPIPPRIKPDSIFQPTPVMDWFLQSRAAANMNWFNQGHAIKLTNGRKFSDLVEAWNKIVGIHPMLRMRLAADESTGKNVIGVVDFRKDDFKLVLKTMHSLAEFEKETQRMQGSLDITYGPVSGVVGEFRDGEDTYCSVIVHHMAIDIVSWHIIWEDLEEILRGGEPEAEASSFTEWASELFSRRPSEAKTQPVSLESGHINNFVDVSAYQTLAQSNTNASGAFLNVKIPIHVITQGADRYPGVETVDFILSGLVLALGKWREMNGVELCFESHGRDLRHERLDLTRTVGWFTYMLPILFRSPPSDLPDLTRFVEEVSRLRTEAMRNVDLARPIFNPHCQAAPHAPATFNYLGRNSHGSSYTAFDKARGIDMGSWEDPNNARPFVFDFESSLDNEHANLGVFYSSKLHSEVDIDRLLALWDESLRSLATASDAVIKAVPGSFWLPDELEQHRSVVETALDTHKIDKTKIERVVPATDLQVAMLLASIGSRSYMHSYDYTLEIADADIDRFCSAWQGILQRHSIFRTFFIPILGIPNDVFDVKMFQVVLAADSVQHEVGGFVVRAPPPARTRAAYGQLLSKVYVYTTEAEQTKITWVCHHALMDAWSRSVVFDDLQRFFSGTAAVLPALPSQFSDVALHQHTMLKDRLAFWQQYMQGVDCEGGILVDHARDAVAMASQPLDRQHRIRFNINPEDITAIATAQRTSTLTIYRAAWALVVSAYNSSDDVVFGTITAGRAIDDIPGIDKVVGPCLNNTPIRAKINWNQTLEEYLGDMSGNCMDVAENEGVSLRRILAVSGGKGSGALFNTTLMFPFTASTSGSAPRHGTGGFKLVPTERDEVTDLPILLTVEPGVSVRGTTVVSLRTHGRDFSDKYLLRLMNSFGCVLESFAAAFRSRRLQEQQLKEIDLLHPDHKAEIDRFATGPTYPSDRQWTSWELLEWRVQQSPDARALEFWRSATSRHLGSTRGPAKKVTYKELKGLVELGARRLCFSVPRLSQKTGRPQRIALFLDKSIELIVGILAAHRLDCAYVPIDMESPPARLTSLMEAIQPTVVLCSSSDINKLPDNIQIPILLVENIFAESNASDHDPPKLRSPSATLSSLAAILFTSGTTGIPKGVQMSHRQVIGYGVMMAGALGYTASDRILGFARPVFDVSQSDIFGSIAAGSTLILSPHGETMARLVPLLRQTHATTTNVTPSVAGLLRPDMLPDIRCLCLAGEKATETVISRWADYQHVKAGRKVTLVNAYGPTEAVVIAWKECHPKTEGRCVGSPAVGMKVWILDEHMRKVPIGARGTIWCSGRQLSDGYFGRDEATRAAFKRNPFLEADRKDDSDIIYNTGDLGAYSATGEIIYFSRNDRQVKINGRRVELGEIENALSSVDIYVSVLLLGSGGREKPIAFHSNKTGGGGSYLTKDLGTSALARSGSLREKAKKTLPQFMIPHEFVAVSEMPLTGNGKVDQKRLKELYEQQDDDTSDNGNKYNGNTTLNAQQRENCLVHFPSPTGLPETQQKRKVFALFAITGVSVQYRQLASHLPSRFSLIGVDNTQTSQLHSIPSMATSHITPTVIQHQPRGPYLLLGFSFAGHLAWETARELLRQGHSVRLVIIDAEARRRNVLPQNAEYSDKTLEKFFDIPSLETLRGLEGEDKEELVAFRENLLQQTRRNIKLHDQFVPGNLTPNRAGDLSVHLVKLCTSDRAKESGNKGEARCHNNCGGECARANGFDEFMPGSGVKGSNIKVWCARASDHFAMLREEACLQRIAEVVRRAFE